MAYGSGRAFGRGDIDPSIPDRIAGARSVLCGVPGPYAVRRPTAKNPGRLEVLTCTRLEGHSSDFHQYATSSGGVVASWGRDGKPNYPPILKAGL